jgi:hypothetical protein
MARVMGRQFSVGVMENCFTAIIVQQIMLTLPLTLAFAMVALGHLITVHFKHFTQIWFNFKFDIWLKHSR